MILASGDGLDQATAAIRDGGRVAHPNGVPEPAPRPGKNVQVSAYDSVPNSERRLIETGTPAFTVQVDRVYNLDEAAEAHRALAGHYLGKLALRVTS